MADLARTKIRSHRVNAALLKFWAPLLWLAPMATLSRGHLFTGRLLICVPSTLAAVFYLSLAIIRLDNGDLRYRRFLTWTPLPRGEILSGGASWHPLIGYIRLKRPVFPWGRLYFVLDPNLNTNPFSRGDYALVHFLTGDAGPQQRRSPSEGAPRNRSLELKLVAAGLIGVVVSLLRFFLSETVHRPALGQAPGNPHLWIALPLRFQDLLGSPLAAVTLCVAFAALAVYKRHRPIAWIYAFLAGGSLPYILSRWLA